MKLLFLFRVTAFLFVLGSHRAGDRIIPWGEWVALIRPCYYKGERGNKPYDLERMLRIYMIQNLYNLSDMGTVTEVIDSRACSHRLWLC